MQVILPTLLWAVIMLAFCLTPIYKSLIRINAHILVIVGSLALLAFQLFRGAVPSFVVASYLLYKNILIEKDKSSSRWLESWEGEGLLLSTSSRTLQTITQQKTVTHYVYYPPYNLSISGSGAKWKVRGGGLKMKADIRFSSPKLIPYITQVPLFVITLN